MSSAYNITKQPFKRRMKKKKKKIIIGTTPYSIMSFRMTLSEIFNDMQHRAVSLRQLSLFKDVNLQSKQWLHEVEREHTVDAYHCH